MPAVSSDHAPSPPGPRCLSWSAMRRTTVTARPADPTDPKKPTIPHTSPYRPPPVMVARPVPCCAQFHDPNPAYDRLDRRIAPIFHDITGHAFPARHRHHSNLQLEQRAAV